MDNDMKRAQGMNDKQLYHHILGHLILNEEGCAEWDMSKTSQGYGQIRYKGKMLRVHRWLWEYLEGPLTRNELVLHKCNNPPCANLAHLYIGDNAQNMRDKVKDGSAKGSKNPHAKLNEAQVLEIKERLANGELQRVLAERFNVDRVTISDIKTRKYWGHI